MFKKLASFGFMKERGKFTVALFMGKVTISLLGEMVVRFLWGHWA